MALIGGNSLVPPGLRGYLLQQQLSQEAMNSNVRNLGGLLGIQQSVAEHPLRMGLLQSQLDAAKTPQPKWQVSERFNSNTGQKEKVIVDLNNPANVIPFGGQETRSLNFQNLGPQVVGLDPVTGQPRVSMQTGMSPGESANLQQRRFEWENISPYQGQSLANQQAGLRIAGNSLWYSTGIDPFAGQSVPGVNPQLPGAQAPSLPGMGYVPGSPRPAQQAPTAQTAQPAQPAPQPMPQSGTMISPKQIQERQALLPKATAALAKVEEDYAVTERLIDQVLGGATGRITGIFGMFPDVPGQPASDTQQALDTLKVRLGFESLQDMRAASPTGGALGQVSEREGKWLQQAKANLERSQSDERLRSNLTDLKQRLKESRSRITSEWDKTYGRESGLPMPTYNQQNDDPLGILR